ALPHCWCAAAPRRRTWLPACGDWQDFDAGRSRRIVSTPARRHGRGRQDQLLARWGDSQMPGLEPRSRVRPFYGNAPYHLALLGSALLFFVGVAGAFDTVYTFLYGHSPWEDVTPPEIHSTFTSVPSCETTLVTPSSKIDEPSGGLFAKKTGIALIQLYAGGERIGEWPSEKRDYMEIVIGGPAYARRTSTEGGPVIAVAHDYSGNFAAKVLEGQYHPPFCYNPEQSAKNGCA